MANADAGVFVVDDQEITLRGIVDLVDEASDLHVVGTGLTIAEAERGLAATRPDVVITDSRLPDGSGIDLCRRIRTDRPDVAVIVLTSEEKPALVFSAIMAGAAGYLMRTVHADELIDGIRRVAAGQSLLDPSVTTTVLDRLRNPDPADDLTPQERRILALIGHGLTNREIGEELSLAEKTIKNYVSSIFAKLHLERRSQAAVWASQHADNLT